MKSKESKKPLSIASPLSGRSVSLDQVPDEVFSGRILGDGCAVIPSDNKIYSPVDGTISSTVETKHAYGFSSDDGFEVLVHFGIDTVSLKGEGFRSYVKAGDRVKKGDLVAEVDVELLKKRGIELITPVLICEGAEDLEMFTSEKEVKAGDTLITLGKEEKAVTSPKKREFNFDFLQKLGKVLMTVIAVMPAAGLMISIGKLIAMAGGDVQLVATIGSVMENIGWAIIGNLHILFAVAIGGSWAKE